MPYARLIVNPTAGGGKTAKKWPDIMSRLKDGGFSFDFVFTEAPGHATKLAGESAKSGYEMVVSVGGDGTTHEVVNGIYEAGGTKAVTLGIIGTGTGSDYIRTIGIPHQYEAAIQRLLNPQKKLVDIGLAEYSRHGTSEKRYFVNFAGLGFDAAIVRATTQRFKALGGISAYLLALLTTFLSYKNVEAVLNIDGKTETKKVCTAIMSNGKYGGGSMLVAPQADPADGLGDFLVIGDLSKPDLLASLPRIYKGTHLTHPKAYLKKAKVVEIQAKESMTLQADGELLGETPAKLSILPAALTIVV